MTIKPIETRYAGHRFRSRLEARWAVFFDTLNIRWEYEPQGYLIGPEHDRPYLPDFWLPEPSIWVEVKGDESTLDLHQLADAAVPHWGLPDSPHEQRMLLLGPIPRVDDGDFVCHSVLSFYKGDIHRHRVIFPEAPYRLAPTRPGLLCVNDGDGDLVGCDDGGPLKALGDYLAADIRQGCEGFRLPLHDAYEAARCARFEHGEAG